MFVLSIELNLLSLRLNTTIYAKLFPQIVRIDVVLGLHLVQLLLLLVHVQSFEGLRRLVIQHHQISITNVESGQVIAGVLGIEYVFVDDERCSTGFRRISPGKDFVYYWLYCLEKSNKTINLHSDLTDGSIFAENVVHFVGCDLVGQVSHIQHPIHLRRQSNLEEKKRK